MKIYHFISILMQGWGCGSIFVMANSLEEARDKARDYGRKYINESLVDHTGYYSEEEEEEKFNKHWAELEDDLNGEPEIDEVFFIRGSD